ncbi:uncharacterized protein LOC143211842 [Lasioglossum baleicum]|uniref:uncharacterized protein LOC143211842 n=1 Tax=Lasioglossum baleicum TaxID=434251 RepID=UPI003FCDF871
METAAKATGDKRVLEYLISEHRENAAAQDQVPNSAPRISEENNTRGVTWPDMAVLLLIDTYREKEAEFSSGLKRHKQVWKEIAAQMNEANYAVSGLQCSIRVAFLLVLVFYQRIY